MLETALKYYRYGLSTVFVGEKKVPIGLWKEKTQRLIKPTEYPKNSGIGIVCGNVSGNLECIDIDTKYDLTGKLYKDYCESIKEFSKDLLPKLTIQKTPSGGFHFIYKCKKIEGNKKLANRPSTHEEFESKKEKFKVLIETRGEGGYFMCSPSSGYTLLHNSFENISEITPEEREILFYCARLLNQVVDPIIIKKEHKKIIDQNLSSFDDYNQRGDVLGFLHENGWKTTLQRGTKNLLLRPGGEGKWSADFDDEKRLFYVWTQSSEFECNKAYNPVQVLTTIKFNGDYSLCSKWLFQNGFGEKQKTIEKKQPKIDISDDNYDFIATNEDTDSYIEQVRNNTFKMGRITGFPGLDKHFRYKPSVLVMFLGHDNVGKSIVTWYMCVLDALFHKEHCIIWPGENKVGGVKKKLMEFYLCKEVKSMTDEEYFKSKKWVEEYFTIIKNDEVYTYNDMLSIGYKLLSKKKYSKFFIDPYNCLWKDTKNEHQYDYKAMIDFRLFIKKTECSVYLNIHAATEALRRLYPMQHEYAGYTMPPKKSDAEGGGKFPNKSDDFLVIHRMTDHPDQWMNTEIHVRKIKEMETGGMPTFMEDPFKIRMVKGGCGFEDTNGFNPVLNYWNPKEKPYNPNFDPDRTIIPNKDFTSETELRDDPFI